MSTLDRIAIALGISTETLRSLPEIALSPPAGDVTAILDELEQAAGRLTDSRRQELLGRIITAMRTK